MPQHRRPWRWRAVKIGRRPGSAAARRPEVPLRAVPWKGIEAYRQEMGEELGVQAQTQADEQRRGLQAEPPRAGGRKAR